MGGGALEQGNSIVCWGLIREGSFPGNTRVGKRMEEWIFKNSKAGWEGIKADRQLCV